MTADPSAIPGPRRGLPGGGAPMGAPDYLDFVSREYLGGYVAHGGSVVKMLVTGNDAVAQELADGLARVGTGFIHLAVDAASTRLHMVDQLFTAIARQLDWTALAATVTERAYRQAGFPPPDPALARRVGGHLQVATVAAFHEVDATELYRSARRCLEQSVLGDDTLSHEFKVAMFRLCTDLFGRGDLDDTEREAVFGWLHGERIPAAALRKVGLHARVARHNARPLLVSLSRFVRRASRPGIVLQLDLERLAVARRPPVGMRDGFYYTKASTLDVYEVLRQLIDATDELEGIFVGVLLPPELMTDETRGLPAYTALHLRVADEVRDRRRPNPYAALVRLGVRLEAVR